MFDGSKLLGLYKNYYESGKLRVTCEYKEGKKQGYLTGGNYWKKIPSTTFQNINKNLRETKIPVENWRTADPGHFHLKKY